MRHLGCQFGLPKVRIRDKKTSRTSRSLVFFEIGFLKNFAIFTGKHLCWSLLAWRSATLLKRHSNTGVFLWILGNFWEHLFLWNTSGGCFWTSLNKIVMKHPWRVAKLYLCWKCSCVYLVFVIKIGAATKGRFRRHYSEKCLKILRKHSWLRSIDS